MEINEMGKSKESTVLRERQIFEEVVILWEFEWICEATCGLAWKGAAGGPVTAAVDGPFIGPVQGVTRQRTKRASPWGIEKRRRQKYSQSHHFWKREGEKVSLLLLLFIGLEFFAYRKLNVSKWKGPSFYFSPFSAALPLPSIPTARRTTRTTSLSRPTASWSRAKSSTDTLTWPKIAWSTWGCFKER